MTVAPTIGELPPHQRAEIIRQLMIKMAERADIGCEINEDEHGVLIYVPKLGR